MDDLVDFLRARLDEDAEAARDALRVMSPGGLYVASFCLHLPPEVQQHNARHDPARVLREVEAKRRIVDRYAWLREHGDSGDAHWVLPTLASVYADRPDFKPEWAPTA